MNTQTPEYSLLYELSLCPREYTQRKAAGRGARDKYLGLPCDPQVHGARIGSAWAIWYIDGYNEAQAYAHQQA